MDIRKTLYATAEKLFKEETEKYLSYKGSIDYDPWCAFDPLKPPTPPVNFFNYPGLQSAIKLLEEEEGNFLKLKIRKVLNQTWELEQNLTPFQMAIRNLEKSNKEKLDLIRAGKEKSRYMFITFNPMPKVTIEEFVKWMAKISKKTCFKQCIYVIEQRGADALSVGEGIHSHMLIERNLKYKLCKLKTNLIISSSKYIKDPKNNALLNMKPIENDWVKDKLEYILGVKTGSGKDKKQVCDIIFRKKENLENYYGTFKIEPLGKMENIKLIIS